LTIVYHVLTRQTTVVEQGADFLDRLEPDRLTRQLVKRLEKLGRRSRSNPTRMPRERILSWQCGFTKAIAVQSGVV
jgi:hypothetical protein